MKVGKAGLALCLLLTSLTIIYYTLTSSSTKVHKNFFSPDDAGTEEEGYRATIQEKSIVKSIQRMMYREPPDGLPSKIFTCGEYQCFRATTYAKNYSAKADLYYFFPHDVKLLHEPPRKEASSLWAAFLKEPPLIIGSSKEHLSKWDGLFNYSLSYLREDKNSKYVFRRDLKKKFPTSTKVFHPKPRMRSLRALQFTSHCNRAFGKGTVFSAREEYILELSKYIHIDVYTSTNKSYDCRKAFPNLVRGVDGAEPPIDDYMFHLSFENSLCKDYITEKFWKVLQSNATTIPVALGGLSIEEYEHVAPPNSFIHVKNFTSPEALADHLKFIAQNDNAFHYYNQWRNEYHLPEKYPTTLIYDSLGDYKCKLCRLAHERPHQIWNTFSKDYGKHQCVDVKPPRVHCPYYNLSCNH